MADENSAEEALVTFYVKSSNDAKYTLQVPLSMSVSELKEKLSAEDYANLPVDRQRLIYSGRVLKDPDTLDSYKIKEGHTVHLVKGAASNQRQNPASQGTTATPSIPAVPTNLSSGTGNNPLAGLTGARYAGFAQLPGQEMFGPDGGMGPPPDPEDMVRMLQNPQFASTLNEALGNPQLIDMMIQQNPLLRDMGPQVRQMMQTPEFRRMMTDPEQLRSMMQMQRMLGGGGMGGRGNPSFPAPGITDNTPGSQPNRQQSPQQGDQQLRQQPPLNPMSLFGNLPAGGGAQGQDQPANPFGALFNPASLGGNPGTTPPPLSSTGQGTPSGNTNSTAGNQQSQDPQQPNTNPFGTLASNPFFQSPQLMNQFLSAMNPNQNPDANNSSSQGQNQNDPNANPLAALMSAMGGGGAGGASPFNPFGMQQPQSQAPPDTRPPEERYEEQLRQLNDMGFYDFDRNVEALRRTGGSVQGAVEYLLSH